MAVACRAVLVLPDEVVHVQRTPGTREPQADIDRVGGKATTPAGHGAIAEFEVPFSGESAYEVMAQQILTAMDAQKIKQRRIEPEVYYLIAKMAA